MDTIDIFARFLKMFPQFHENISAYAAHGRNSVTIWFKNKQVMDFTYNNDSTWELHMHKEN